MNSVYGFLAKFDKILLSFSSPRISRGYQFYQNVGMIWLCRFIQGFCKNTPKSQKNAISRKCRFNRSGDECFWFLHLIYHRCQRADLSTRSSCTVDFILTDGPARCWRKFTCESIKIVRSRFWWWWCWILECEAGLMVDLRILECLRILGLTGL